MANTPVIGPSPLSMNLSGRHVMLPLTALSFDETGALKADGWPGYAGNETAVDTYLHRLLLRGAIRPGAKPTAKPAFLAQAASGGAAPRIVIDISNVTSNAADPPKSTADVAVTETETYSGLKAETLKETIGTVAGGGTKPGLVFVKSDDVALPAAGTYPTAGDPGTADIPKNGGGGSAFALQTRAGGADAALTSIEIKDVEAAAETFTLVATWTKTVAATAMDALAAAVDYAVVITAPAGGYLAPAAGTTTLAGGSDRVAAPDPVKASAIVLAQ